MAHDEECARELSAGARDGESDSRLGVPEDWDASLVHLYPALGADELFEEAPHLPLRAGVTVELPASGTLPRYPPPETPDLPVALDTVAPDQTTIEPGRPI